MEYFILIFFVSLGAFLIGGFLVASRSERKFSSSPEGRRIIREQKNPLDDKPLLEQLKSKETWERVRDGMSMHDPRSDKGKAIKSDVVGTLGVVPFTVVILISIGLLVLAFFII